MAAAVVSPELVLVDPGLREAALAELPHVEPFEFLRFHDSPHRHPDLDLFGVLAGYDDLDPAERATPRWVAATVYAVVALTRAVAFDVALFVVIAAVVALAQL
jgi:hypothetical protein